MVDFHKGFEGFEKMGPSDKEKKEEDLSLSGELKEEDLLGTKADLEKTQVLYDGVLELVKDVLDKARDSKESAIDGSQILNEISRFCNTFESSIDPGNAIQLVFHKDEHQPNYLYTHSVNVCFLSMCLALALNFSKSKLVEVAIAALFHDIGMMKVPEDVWNKAGKLSRGEYDKVQKHALYGEEIFKKMPEAGDAVPVIIGQHHEKIDGTGYPKRFTKEDIHYGARLIALVDNYEARTHTRLWRSRFLPDEAIQEILDDESGSYDNHFLKAILRHISIFPMGTLVKISSGEVGVVVSTNEETPMRPIINIVYDREGTRLTETRLLDLSKQLLIHVERCIDPTEMGEA